MPKKAHLGLAYCNISRGLFVKISAESYSEVAHEEKNFWFV